LNLDLSIIEKLNNNKDNNLIPIYLSIQKYFEEQLGQNTVVLIEIGSFFEVYQNEIIGKSKEIAEILNIQLSRKNKKILEISDKNPYMAGIPSITIDKYINILMKTKSWNVVLINQKKENGKVIRYFDKILSPGTNIDFLNNDLDNYLTSIYIEKSSNGIYISGITSTDVSTGKTFIKETIGTKEDKELALDNIINHLSSHVSSEIILHISDNIIDKELDNIIFKIKSFDKPLHLIKRKTEYKISYQNKLLEKVFSIQSFLSPIEELNLEKKFNILKSLINLLEFIISHDHNLGKRMKKPIFIEDDSFVELGNNALLQLNILNNDNTSVINVVDYTSTVIGKRLLKERITKPIFNKKELTRRYELTEFLLANTTLSSNIDMQLKNIYDIERLQRRININTIHPMELFYFYDSFQSILLLLKFLSKDYAKFSKLINKNNNFIIDTANIINFIEGNFDLDEIYKYKNGFVTGNFLNKTKYVEIEKLLKEQKDLDLQLQTKTLELVELSNNELNLEDFKVNYTDLDGFYIETSRRKFDNVLSKVIGNDFMVKKLKGNVKITSTEINKLSNVKIVIDNKIIMLNNKYFKEIIEKINEDFNDKISDLIMFIAEIDVYNSCAKLVINRKYTVPNIVDTKQNETFIEAKAIRHSIIETIEENGIYVPNDITLGNLKYSTLINEFEENIIGDKTNGILLYGINSSGKSSFNKSLGIATILAQSGIPVPATTFNFSLFKKVYTRITGSDDIYKGLSTFAIEMIELKNILNRCKKASLVLGDEISHGTENISGLSIVAATIETLSKTSNIFSFSTHLHELPKLEDIKKIQNIIHLHLSISYEENSGQLIYDRKLKLGSGSSIYGIEFIKYLNLDSKFISLSEKYRKTITENLSTEELIIQNKTSNYNTDLNIDKCFFCSLPVEDTHHLNEKRNADSAGLIEHFHQNHKYNLLPLCKKHHKILHKSLKELDLEEEEIIKWVSTTNGNRLYINPIIIDKLDISNNQNEIISF
jgi:DNA mismatch repair protein MutS